MATEDRLEVTGLGVLSALVDQFLEGDGRWMEGERKRQKEC